MTETVSSAEVLWPRARPANTIVKARTRYLEKARGTVPIGAEVGEIDDEDGQSIERYESSSERLGVAAITLRDVAEKASGSLGRDFMYNFRFFSYNMAKSSSVSMMDLCTGFAFLRQSRHQSQRCLSEDQSFYRLMVSGLPDEGNCAADRANLVDCAFATLCETRQSLAHFDRQPAYSLSAEAMFKDRGLFEATAGKVAGKINGDLRTLAICSSKLEESEDGEICVPFDHVGSHLKANPMKCILGKTFDVACGGVRICLLGTHFPMQRIRALMQNRSSSATQTMDLLKEEMARNLRKVLRSALEVDTLDDHTILILQGDLNSRTVLCEGGVFKDLLSATLEDEKWQHFMVADLPPHLHGEWREVATFEDDGRLPVTYKFDDSAVPDLANNDGLSLNSIFPFYEGDPVGDDPQAHYRDAYAKNSMNIEAWGLKQQDPNAEDFRVNHMASCTERVLFYAARALQIHCCWEAPRGYEVNYTQVGSDHKPVLLEATLVITSSLHPEPTSPVHDRPPARSKTDTSHGVKDAERAAGMAEQVLPTLRRGRTAFSYQNDGKVL